MSCKNCKGRNYILNKKLQKASARCKLQRGNEVVDVQALAHLETRPALRIQPWSGGWAPAYSPKGSIEEPWQNANDPWDATSCSRLPKHIPKERKGIPPGKSFRAEHTCKHPRLHTKNKCIGASYYDSSTQRCDCICYHVRGQGHLHA